MRLSTAIFQKTRRPLQGSGRIYSVPPERNDKQALKPPAVRTVWPSVPLADGQRNQLAIVAVSVQPVTLDHRAHPQTGTVDAGASDETAVDLAQQVQIAFLVTYRNVAGKHRRTRELAARQRIVTPEYGGRALVDTHYRAVCLAHVDATVAQRDT